MTGHSEAEAAALVAEATPAEEEKKASFLELFFDLVFVFAFTQVTALILEDTSAAGFARAVLVLAMVWWAWSAYTWMTNAIDVESLVTRLIVFAAMAATFFLALDKQGRFAIKAPCVFLVRLAGGRFALKTPQHQNIPSGDGFGAGIQIAQNNQMTGGFDGLAGPNPACDDQRLLRHIRPGLDGFRFNFCRGFMILFSQLGLIDLSDPEFGF